MKNYFMTWCEVHRNKIGAALVAISTIADVTGLAPTQEQK
ncbi:MAG: hypothetical protein BroJett038_24140 [Chloroflexota bacterium]|jgi:hypothetical protein|nr:MAG: hypothetical protein BroJett038_24140 [Chloroflexota bacterium]